MHSFPSIFFGGLYAKILAPATNYKIHADARYCTLYIFAVVLLPSESPAIINDLVFLVKRFNNLTLRRGLDMTYSRLYDYG